MKANMKREMNPTNGLVVALFALLVFMSFQWIQRKRTA
jgi:hypothetical protein